jgi:hypothetical protein
LKKIGVKGADRWGPAVSERGKKKKGVRELGCRGWLACWAGRLSWVND